VTGHEVTVARSDEPATVVQLLRDDLCTAQCLAAGSPTESCDGCACNGEFHGHLANAVVPGSRRALPPAAEAEPALFDVAEPAARAEKAS
jgi:hypothetical protein